MSATDLQDLAWSRITEHYITDTRTQRIGNQETINWKADLLNRKKIYRGEWLTNAPDKSIAQKTPRVLNMLQSGTDDLSRIAGESQATGFSPPKSSSSRDIHKAHVRESIAKTYWMKNRADTMLPYLVQDASLAGIMALACIPPSSASAYPMPVRLDPASCYPDVLNGQLQDMVTTVRIRKRQAEFLLGVDLSSVGARDTDDVELVDYFHPMGHIRLVDKVANEGPGGTPIVVYRERYDLEYPAVGFYMLPSADGRFHGLFDQILGLMQTQHEIADLMLDYAWQGIHSPWREYGVQNPKELPGPTTIYHGIDEKFVMERIPPAIESPQMFQMLDWIETQTRAGGFQPQSRSGQVDQSIASGEFVNSTQGGLTSLSRGVLRGIADLRSQWTSIALQLDTKFGNVEKPLYRPVGNQYTYTPAKDIDGVHDFLVSYGTGAGLDYLNRKAAIEQELGAGLISKETAMSQMDDITDPEGEKLRIDRELAESAYLQKTLNMDDPTALGSLILKLDDGLSMSKAIAEVAKEQMAQQQAMQAQQQQTQPGAPQELPQPGNGAQPTGGGPQPGPGATSPAQEGGNAPPPISFTPSAPLTSIQIRGAA